jgi:radical SAM protein with 4Fe4S-binding SPASM domain
MPLTRMCYQPWTSVNVLADGQVYACCVVNADMAIGDLNAESLSEIIQGEKAHALKQRLLRGDIEDIACHGCPNAPMGEPAEFERTLAARLGLRESDAA